MLIDDTADSFDLIQEQFHDLLHACREAKKSFNHCGTKVLDVSEWNRITNLLSDAIQKAEGNE